MLFVSACVSAGLPTSVCTAHDKPIILPTKIIDQLPRDAAVNILDRNEDLAKRGCAKPK